MKMQGNPMNHPEPNKDYIIQSLQAQLQNQIMMVAEREAIISQLYERIRAHEEGDTNDKGRSAPHKGAEEKPQFQRLRGQYRLLAHWTDMHSGGRAHIDRRSRQLHL